MKRFRLVIVLIVLVNFSAYGQRYFGIATSNWSGLNAMYLNPANIADDRDRFSISLISFNIGVDNNLGTINTGNVLKQFVKGDSIGLNKVINIKNTGQFNMMAPSAEVRGPGFMISIDHKSSIAITTSVRAMNQFENFDQTLFRVLSGANSINLGANSTLLNLQNFRWMLNAWSQVGATYSRVLLEKKKHQLKAGLTLNYLGGIAYAGFKGNQLNASYTVAKDPKTGLADSTTLNVTSSNVDYASNVLTSLSALQNGISSVDVVNYLFGKKAGSGVGADVGLVYEFRPGYPDRYEYEMDGTNHFDYTQNMYKVRVSVSVTDIGSINYNQNNVTANINGSGYISSNQGSTNFNNFNDVRNFALSHGFGVFDTSAAKSTRVYLPTAMLAGIDYHIVGTLYANATYLADLTNHNNFGTYYYNQFTLTPRFDSRNLSIGVPITYSSLTNTVKVGVGFRYSGFFVGSDDMLAAFNNNQYGFNVYFGAFIPINKKKIKDRDGDKVSDRMDLCPTIPGELSARGCPDRDHDSVADMDDRCPDDSGSVELQGCPDRDDDGVPDIDDKCPDVPGLEQFDGCPDTDGDGVPDNEDLCPTIPGPVKYHGCPDTDGDGVPDNIDKCPTVPGPPSNQGCPIETKKEKEKATERKVPQISEAKAKVEHAAHALAFETGKAVIKSTSFKSLNEVVKVLKEHPDAYMTIDGYTDNTGSPEKNMRLSEARAEAVKNYFVKHGVSANRLISTGHGETNPIDTNSTPEGRAKNRRVVMEMKED